jgi:hypothetical protein
MRISYGLWLVLVAGACSVPDKRPADDLPDDAGIDAGDASVAIDAPPPVIDGPVDLEAPETTIDEAPAAFSPAGQATFRFSSDDPAATFECRIDEELPEPCRSPYARTLPDGPHSFSVRALDLAGNGDDTPAERLWTIDTIAPDTTLTDGPPSADNSVTASFAFRSAERNVSFDCALDNAGYLPCTSGSSFGPVGDGPHAFSVRARDRAGNVDPSPAIYAWTVNTSTPDTQILSGPVAASQSTGASFTFFSPDAGGGATFTCSIDGSSFAACTSPRSYSNLDEGEHTFAVRVRDAVGNLDPSPATRTWRVDLTPPNTTIVDGPSGAVPVASASFAFSANEESTFSCSVDGGDFAQCTSPASMTGLGQGAHTFAVRATDGSGRVDPSPATRTWTVDTVAPDVEITAGPVATSGPRVSFNFTASEGSIACSLDGAAFAACASPVATNLPAGEHSFAVRALDAADNVTTVTRTWTVACAAPDPTGAAGLLHLDESDQTLANAVVGGASATLGATIDVEPEDPAVIAAARFGGGLGFTAAGGGALVAWPVALPAMPDVTIELWARPSSAAGARPIATSEDGRIVLRVTAASPTTVRFSIAIAEGGDGGATRTVTSAPVAAAAWHHVVASLHQPALRLWVDGVRTEVATVELGAPLAIDALRLGGTGAAAYDGALDEVWVAQTAFTTDEAVLGRYCPL